MNLAARKYNLIQELTTIDEALLEKLEINLKTAKKLLVYKFEFR